MFEQDLPGEDTAGFLDGAAIPARREGAELVRELPSLAPDGADVVVALS